jgi:large subunit ribosomal protein L5
MAKPEAEKEKAPKSEAKRPPEGAPQEKRKKAAKGELFATVEVARARGDSPSRLRVRFEREVIPALMKDFGFKNPMQVPRLHKIVVNMGLGEAIQNNKIIESAVAQLAMITGQRAVVTKSRKAIANFKLRENQSIGAMVTLRRDRMYEFLDRLIAIALPRVRDFKGVSAKAFDGKGNYTVGIREQIIFPEINYDEIEKVKGMNVTIVTTAKNDEEGRALLKYLGLPFRN